MCSGRREVGQRQPLGAHGWSARIRQAKCWVDTRRWRTFLSVSAEVADSEIDLALLELVRELAGRHRTERIVQWGARARSFSMMRGRKTCSRVRPSAIEHAHVHAGAVRRRKMAFLPRIMEKLRARRPTARFRSVAVPTGQLAHELEKGEVDLAVGYFPALTLKNVRQRRVSTQPLRLPDPRRPSRARRAACRWPTSRRRSTSCARRRPQSGVFERFIERRRHQTQHRRRDPALPQYSVHGDAPEPDRDDPALGGAALHVDVAAGSRRRCCRSTRRRST